MADVDYSFLSDRDRLLIAQDRLRSLEREHFRLSLLESGTQEHENAQVRMAQIEPKMAEVRGIVEALTP